MINFLIQILYWLQTWTWQDMIKKHIRRIKYQNCACHQYPCTCIELEMRNYSYAEVYYEFNLWYKDKIGIEFKIPFFKKRIRLYESKIYNLDDETETGAEQIILPTLVKTDTRLTEWLKK